MVKKPRILLAGLLIAVLGFVVLDPLRLRELWYHSHYRIKQSAAVALGKIQPWRQTNR